MFIYLLFINLQQLIMKGCSIIWIVILTIIITSNSNGIPLKKEKVKDSPAFRIVDFLQNIIKKEIKELKIVHHHKSHHRRWRKRHETHTWVEEIILENVEMTELSRNEPNTHIIYIPNNNDRFDAWGG